jgi:hypothetical protein
LLEQGISHERIDGGFEFGGLHVFFRYWPRRVWAIDDEYIVSYSAAIDGYRTIERRSYGRLLPPREETLSLHRRESAQKSEPLTRGRCDRPL